MKYEYYVNYCNFDRKGPFKTFLQAIFEESLVEGFIDLEKLDEEFLNENQERALEGEEVVYVCYQDIFGFDITRKKII